MDQPIVLTEWREFSRVMIETADIDPSYPVIAHLCETRHEPWLGRFFLHYMWFYNIREAIRAADDTDDRTFWRRCEVDAASSRVSRGGARRRFRGALASTAILLMQGKNMTPWQIMTDLYRARYVDIYTHVERNYKGCQIGPYYRWKLMDWFDICLGWPVSLSILEATKVLPDNPREHIGTYFPGLSFEQCLLKVDGFVKDIPHFVKPGVGCGIGEVETILCILKGYFDTRSIKVGGDILEYRHKLADLPELQAKCPPVIVPANKWVCGEYKYVP